MANARRAVPKGDGTCVQDGTTKAANALQVHPALRDKLNDGTSICDEHATRLVPPLPVRILFPEM